MENLRITDLQIYKAGPFLSESINFPIKQNPNLAEVHILTGENSTGKSTMLLMLSSILPTASSVIKKRFWDRTSNFTVRFSNQESITITDETNLERLSTLHSIPNFLKEYYNKIRFPKLENQFDYAFFAYSGFRKLGSQRLLKVEEITSHPLSEALNFDHSTNTGTLIQWIANMRTKQALAYLNGDINRSEYYETAILRIEECLSDIFEFNLKFLVEDDPLNVFIVIDDKKLSFEVLPDGFKSVISWISDLLMRMDRIQWLTPESIFDRNIIIYLDEIDVHLHPAMQRKILPVIQKLFRNAQIFVSTHSPFVVGSVDGAWIHMLKRNRDGNVSFSKPLLSEDAKSYTLILNEIFNVNSYYGIDIEKKLEEFRTLRNKLVHSKRISPDDIIHLQSLISFFKNQNSEEIKNSIGMEMAQLKKLIKIDEINI